MLQKWSALTRDVAVQFDRERIPERVVHARGAAAKGFFEVCVAHNRLKAAAICKRTARDVPSQRLRTARCTDAHGGACSPSKHWQVEEL